MKEVHEEYFQISGNFTVPLDCECAHRLRFLSIPASRIQYVLPVWPADGLLLL